MRTKRVVIIGGGFAGISAAVGAVEQGGVEVELISPDPYLVIKPRLYEADLSGVRVPLAGVLGPIGVTQHRAAVVMIDTGARNLTLDDDSGLPYDELVLAAGSRLPLPDGASVHAADSYAQAVELNRAVATRGGHAVVVGAGFTGLELAADLAGRLDQVTLLEGGPRVAPGYGPRGRAVIEHALGTLGVSTRTGAPVAAAVADGLLLTDGTRIAADLIVWAAGPRASALAEQISDDRDSSGRLLVDEHLRTTADGVWAAGDCAAACVDGRNLSVMSCQHAGPQGRRAGANAAIIAAGGRPRRYRQPLYLTCLALGGYGALVTTGFERDAVVVAGSAGAPLKRYINHRLIYPPPHGDREQVLKIGKPEPPGRLGAWATRQGLRSGRVRARLTAGAADRAAAYSAREAAFAGVHD
jgi:NADH dehydrogenase